jgi:hypothetical protein
VNTILILGIESEGIGRIQNSNAGCWSYKMTGYECTHGLKVEVKESRVEVLGSFHRISSDHDLRLFIITDRHLWL